MLQCRYFMRDQILKSKQHWEPITGKPKSKQAKIPLKPSNTHKYIATEILQATKGQDLRHQFHQSWPKAQNTHKLDGRKTQKKFTTISSRFASNYSFQTNLQFLTSSLIHNTETSHNTKVSSAVFQAPGT